MPARAGLRMFMGVKVVVRGWGWRCLPGAVVRQRLTQELGEKLGELHECILSLDIVVIGFQSSRGVRI